MLIRHFVSVLFGVQRIVVLIGLLTLLVGSRSLSAQSQLAQDAYAIFEASCLNCHGPDGAFRETLLMEHSELIDGGTVVPGNPNASELYKRLLGPTENGAQMPFGLPQLPPQSIDTVRRWILAGAPDWTITTTTLRRFITPREVLTSIETHLNSLSSFDRSFARYFTLTHLYNAGETPEILAEYRTALYKLVNSLSWGSGIINPQPIDPQATIYYIDLRHYEWDVNDGWTKLEEVYPYHISFDADLALRNQLGRLGVQMKTEVPSVHVDWFIATASTPPLYHDLLSLPLTDRDLETRLEVDVARNLVNAPGVRVWRAGFNNSGVSNHNRVVERHTSRYGAYWKSYDFAGSVGTQNILTHPLNFTHDGGEVIFNLPNGLQGYYLVNASGFRLDEAPINIVSNPAASDPTVRNGISCIGCHTEGMKTFEDEVRSVIESNPNPPYDKAQALRLYVEQSDMDARVSEDMETFRVALEATGGEFGGVEPISRFHEAFQGPIGAAYAAAVVGLQTETFLRRVRENTGLQNVGLLALDNPNGSVKRDTWTSSFRNIISALDYPDRVGEPPDITQPDVLPGGHVHIPDSNLRAVIAAELGKSPNDPITVLEIKRLRNIGAFGRGIRDLTGLQHATNLFRLVIENDQVSDISPIAGLTNLRELSFEDNPVSDLSPVKGLINLTWLEFDRTRVSEISPVRGLVNLNSLEFHNTEVSDLSPVRDLTNLTRLAFHDTLVSDLTSVSGLINLEALEFGDTGVSDLSPIRGLTKLKHLHFSGANVSDASPIARLINLEHISFTNNFITDISPFAGLSKLKTIGTWGNRFSDISPLAGLRNLERLDICGAELSDLSPLANLTGLKELYLRSNSIPDISPLAGLTGLNRLSLAGNQLSDLAIVSGLTNLKWLDIHDNEISDLSPLVRLTNLSWLNIHGNSVSDLSPLARLPNLKWLDVTGNEIADFSVLDAISDTLNTLRIHEPGVNAGPKIEGPWLWVFLPTSRHKLNENVDLLAQASGGSATELKVATAGATEGKAVGDEVWTLDILPPTGRNNLVDMMGRKLPDGVLYGAVILYSPMEQQTVLHLGADQEVKVWLNGEVMYQRERSGHAEDFIEAFGVTLLQGRNVLMVAVGTRPDDPSNLFIGLAADADYSTGAGIDYVLSEPTIHSGDTFTLDVRAENVVGLAGWQFDIAFEPARLEALGLSEGGFLRTDGGSTFFQSGSIDNAAGKITGLIAGRISEGGVSGSGTVVQVRFKAKSEGETRLTLQNFLFGSVAEESIAAGPLEFQMTIEERLLPGDVNRDGIVNILDLIRVAQQLGKRVSADSPVDINGDGIVNIFDLTLVAQGIAGAAAPPAQGLDSTTIQVWISEARLADDGSLLYRQGIANLETLLATLIPKETALLANYPNPFNPETWIPYQLATPAEVVLKIYDTNGGAVRRIDVGHQAAGIYQSQSRAVYWDGRNARGEPVASGLYFYTLSAGDFTATRKMLIKK